MITYDIITWDNMDTMGKTFREGLKRRTTAEKYFNKLVESKKFAMITLVKTETFLDTPTAILQTSGAIKTYDGATGVITEKE